MTLPVPDPATSVLLPTEAPGKVVPPSTNRLFGELAEAVDRFRPLELDAIRDASLMDRVETKYLLPAAEVSRVLERCFESHDVLEVRGHRLCRYWTTYFDTPDLRFYRLHHGARATRQKVRIRSYRETGEHFLEVKSRTNKGRSLKGRRPVGSHRIRDVTSLLTDSALGRRLSVPPESLRRVVSVRYLRLTLLDRSERERVTLDVGIQFREGDAQRSYPRIAVAEVKQDRRRTSHFIRTMRELGLRRISLSKYCVGVATLDPTVKHNRFKRTLRRVRAVGQ